MKTFIIILLLISSTQLVIAQQNETIQEGNNYYRQQQFDKAADEYQKWNMATRFTAVNASNAPKVTISAARSHGMVSTAM